MKLRRKAAMAGKPIVMPKSRRKVAAPAPAAPAEPVAPVAPVENAPAPQTA